MGGTVAPIPDDLLPGTGAYRNADGEGLLVELGNGEGKLTLNALSHVSRSGGA